MVQKGGCYFLDSGEITFRKTPKDGITHRFALFRKIFLGLVGAESMGGGEKGPAVAKIKEGAPISPHLELDHSL